MTELPEQFILRMKSELGSEFESFLKSYEKPAEKAIRINTLKITAEHFKKISPFSLEQVEWEQNGFYVNGTGLGKTVYHAAGLYYVQEPSAMSVAPQLKVRGGERVLDLCSAPGGKGTQLAQYMRGSGILVLNELNFSRAKILSSNVERMGIKNCIVTCATPEKLAENAAGYFDKILVDAPCSGEGMFKKEESAIPEWSLQNVKACAKRQADILDNAYKMLAVSGTMVYSTCTFAPEEDEEQIQNFANTHSCEILKTEKLYPHKVRGEGHFYCVIKKTDGQRIDLKLTNPEVRDRKFLAAYRQWESGNLKIKFDNLHAVGNTLYSLPENMPEINVQTLRAGIRLGEFTDRFEPDHSLAMCLNIREAYCVEVDEKTALNYLHGLTFECAEKSGWRLVTYSGFPLGWCKAVNGVAKNKLPKGLRI